MHFWTSLIQVPHCRPPSWSEGRLDELLCKYVSHCFNYCNLDPNGLTHNRFVDRNMFMRYIGGGISHLEQFSSGNDGDKDLAVQSDDCMEVEKVSGLQPTTHWH